jgi:hypothetical protein
MADRSINWTFSTGYIVAQNPQKGGTPKHRLDLRGSGSGSGAVLFPVTQRVEMDDQARYSEARFLLRKKRLLADEKSRRISQESLQFWEAQAAPLLDAVRTSERIAGDDLSIYINATS